MRKELKKQTCNAIISICNSQSKTLNKKSSPFRNLINSFITNAYINDYQQITNETLILSHRKKIM